MPCLAAALNSSTEPFITPWSVRPMAGWPSSAARAARASILQAPSSSEYSEWTCRWAQAGVLTDLDTVAGRSDAGQASDQAEPARCGVGAEALTGACAAG